MEKGSDVSAKFGFGKPNADNDKQTIENDNSPVEGTTSDTLASTKEDIVEKISPVKEGPAIDENNIPYEDKRTITIALVKNYSLYRKKNDKVLPKRKDYIGSSIEASRIITSNKEEMEAYMPNIIGLSPNDPNFIRRIKQYFNNIRIPVDELNRTFDISFVYNSKKDYYRFKVREEEIEEKYSKINRQNIDDIRKGLKEKIRDLNLLESEKHNFGHPVNVEEYLMYRHCLLYNDIAKDMAFINSDINIRFYFKDDRKEAEKLRKYRNAVNLAKSNYVACIANKELFDYVYIQYCVINGLPIISSLAEDELDKELKLDKFSTENPIKFNEIYKDKDIKIRSMIEMLIARGELIRPQFSQNITSIDGTFIGANVNEAILWFKNPENAHIVNAYQNKLNNI